MPATRTPEQIAAENEAFHAERRAQQFHESEVRRRMAGGLTRGQAEVAHGNQVRFDARYAEDQAKAVAEMNAYYRSSAK